MGVVTLIHTYLLFFPRYSGETESIMLVNDHDIQIPLPQCLNNTCSHNCQYHLVRTKRKRENENNFCYYLPSPTLSLSPPLSPSLVNSVIPAGLRTLPLLLRRLSSNIPTDATSIVWYRLLLTVATETCCWPGVQAVTSPWGLIII